jgi:hypothetical protein
MELEEGSNVFMSGADIQDCFYAVHIPSMMQDYFCLGFDVTREEAALISGSNSCDFGKDWVSPCINVLPMGFSWSFYLVQQIHQQSVLRSLSIDEDALSLRTVLLLPSPNIPLLACLTVITSIA